MFFPEAMTELELIVPSKDLLAVTKVLGSQGVFHQIDSTYLGLENLGPNTWQEKAASYSALERRIQVIMQNLNLKEEYSGTSTFDSIADLEPLQTAVDRIEGDVRKTSDQLAAEKKNLEQFESQLHQLEPIADANVDVGALRKSDYLYSVLGIIPAENVSRLETSLSRVPHTIFTLREDPKKPVVWVLGPRSSSDVIDRAVKSAYLNPLTLPEEFEGTPVEITASLRKAIETSKQKIAEIVLGCPCEPADCGCNCPVWSASPHVCGCRLGSKCQVGYLNSTSKTSLQRDPDRGNSYRTCRTSFQCPGRLAESSLPQFV